MVALLGVHHRRNGGNEPNDSASTLTLAGGGGVSRGDGQCVCGDIVLLPCLLSRRKER